MLINRKKVKTLNNQNGIALILSVVIVVSLLGVVVAVANITRHISRNNILIEASEIAFLAADSAAEVALYEIIKNGQGVNLPDRSNQPFAINGATWDRDIDVALTVSSRCDVTDPKPVCTDNPGPVSSTNPLRILVEDGDSFQFDFDIAGATYPSGVDLSGNTLNQADVIVSSNDIQTHLNPGSQVILNDLGSSSGTRMRFTNRAGGRGSFTLVPQGVASLPVGINISTVGEYLGVERRIEITKPAWLIYR